MKHKKPFFFPFMILAAYPLMAQDLLPAGMQNLADSVIDMFQGPFVKAILAIFLCGAAVAYGFNKDNEKVKRNCIAIAVAAAILIGATTIVGAVWEASGG
jgi:type IV secretory pathway VirB2 component (pilin)